MGHTSQRGLEGQTAVLNRLVQLGYEVLLPWGDDHGYDLAYYTQTEERQYGFFVHKEIQVVRVQCKVAWLLKDGSCLMFNTSTASMGWLVCGRRKGVGIVVEPTGLECIILIRGKFTWFLCGKLLLHLRCVSGCYRPRIIRNKA